MEPPSSACLILSFPSLQNKSKGDRIVCESLLESGRKEKDQGKLETALLFFEQALQKSEEKKQLPLLLQAVEHIGDLFLTQKNIR